jgi:hypothetical protein
MEAISMFEMRRSEGAAYFLATSWEDYLREQPYSSIWRYLETNFKAIAHSPPIGRAKKLSTRSVCSEKLIVLALV